MYTIEPDYTISDSGYPQYRRGDNTITNSMCEQKLNSKCWATIATSSFSSPTTLTCGTPNRLLPLRETLSDYNKRLCMREHMDKSNGRWKRAGEYNLDDDHYYVDDNNDDHDALVQQKQQKNRFNEQRRIKGNQKCRDKGKTATKKLVHDLNSF